MWVLMFCLKIDKAYDVGHICYPEDQTAKKEWRDPPAVCCMPNIFVVQKRTCIGQYPKIDCFQKAKYHIPAQTITSQLNDKPELSPYFPDGTLCHQDDSGSKYYCQVLNNH